MSYKDGSGAELMGSGQHGYGRDGVVRGGEEGGERGEVRREREREGMRWGGGGGFVSAEMDTFGKKM